MRPSIHVVRHRRWVTWRIVAVSLVVFVAVYGLVSWSTSGEIEASEVTKTSSSVVSAQHGPRLLASNPSDFLLGFVETTNEKLLICASDVEKKPKGPSSRPFVFSIKKGKCDVFLVKDGDDLRHRGMIRIRPRGYALWSWPKTDEQNSGPRIFGLNPHPSFYFLDRHLMEQVHRMEVEGRVWLLMRKPAKPFVNPSLEAFLNDRRNPEYSEGPRSKECYCFIITIPYNFGKEMADEHMTAVYQLRKKDPSRDVVTFLVLNTPPGAIEGRGWGKTSEEEWNRTHLPQIESVRRKLTTLGSKVFVRRRIPQRPLDDSMYYQFDYQKIYAWNLQYEQVAFLDADMMIGNNPGSIFPLCGRHFYCGVQDSGAYGGYMNNGVFVVNPTLENVEELLHAWWKPSPPWRQIALQDITMEVYAFRWKALPDAFNFQGLKHGHFHDPCNAQFVHFKDCHKRLEIPFCAQFMKDKQEAIAKFPDLFK